MVTGARLNDEAATDYPGKRPQTVWGSKKIMYYNVDDGVNVADDVDDDDDGGGVVDDDAADDDDDDDEGDDKGGDGDGDGDDDGDGDGDGDDDDDVHVHVDVDADVDVDGDVDVDVEEEEEMMMMLRRMMLRRKTDPKTGKHTLCEPAQSKCTRTFHKRHFVRKFTGKMPDTSDITSIEHRALTPTVRAPQCGHTVWGTKR